MRTSGVLGPIPVQYFLGDPPDGVQEQVLAIAAVRMGAQSHGVQAGVVNAEQGTAPGGTSLRSRDRLGGVPATAMVVPGRRVAADRVVSARRQQVAELVQTSGSGGEGRRGRCAIASPAAQARKVCGARPCPCLRRRTDQQPGTGPQKYSSSVLGSTGTAVSSPPSSTGPVGRSARHFWAKSNWFRRGIRRLGLGIERSGDGLINGTVAGWSAGHPAMARDHHAPHLTPDSPGCRAAWAAGVSRYPAAWSANIWAYSPFRSSSSWCEPDSMMAPRSKT